MKNIPKTNKICYFGRGRGGGGGGGGGEFLPKRPENTACQPKQISGSRVGTKLKHCQNTKSILKPRGILNTLQENTEVHSCMTSYCNSMNEVLDKTDSVHGS